MTKGIEVRAWREATGNCFKCSAEKASRPVVDSIVEHFELPDENCEILVEVVCGGHTCENFVVQCLIKSAEGIVKNSQGEIIGAFSTDGLTPRDEENI